MGNHGRVHAWRGAAALALLVAGPWLSGSAFGERFIVKDGEPQAEIIISRQPPRTTKLAAEELRKYIERITGARLPIGTRPSRDVSVQVYVGRSPFTDRRNITDDGLDHGAFRIKSGENWLVLLGRDRDFAPPEPHMRSRKDAARALAEWDKRTGEKFSYPHTQLWKRHGRGLWEADQRGSFNAVCEFLRMHGVRWYMPTELGEVVPRNSTIALPRIGKTVRPDFALRKPNQIWRSFGMPGATPEEIMWQLRMGFNRGSEIFGHSGIAHGINTVVGREAVREAHPEYLALFNGERDTEKRRQCLSSEGLLEANVRFARAMFDVYDAPSVSVMPQDGYASMCECSLCRGKGTPERGWYGLMSDYVWSYVNRAAQELYKTHPDKKISCLAYGTYMLPPTKIEKLSPNILVGIYQTRRDFYKPAYREQIEETRRRWLAKLPEGNKKIWLYEYYLHTRPNHTYEFVPVFFPHIIAEDLRSLQHMSIGEHVATWREVKRGSVRTLAANHLNLYVTGRLWWDVEQDVDALLEEYYTNFYGPARDEMKAFIEYCEANWMDLKQDEEKIEKVFELLGKAQEKVPADTVYGRRIALIADYIKPLKNLPQQLAKGREDAPEARAYSRRGADVTLDGKLDEPFWQGMATYSLKELETGRAPACGTSFKVAWAQDSLYLGVVCQDVDTAKLSVGSTSDEDRNIFRGDTIELLIETQTHAYYQIAISPAGALVDLDRKGGPSMRWSSQAEAAANVGDDAWTVEVRIPVAAEDQDEIDPDNGVAGRRPSATYPWYFNLCRQRVRGRSRELSAFSPTGQKTFHDVMKFGRLYVR